MDWKPVKGRLLPTPAEALEACLDYAAVFLRIQVDWLVYFGILKGDDEDDGGQPPMDEDAGQPPPR